MTIEEKAKAYDEALYKANELIRKMDTCSFRCIKEDIEDLFSHSVESEDERTRKEILDFIKSFWADHKESIPQISSWIAYLERQKEPHFTKRNALFDKCVENCDPKIMKRVSDEVDEMLEKEQKLYWKPTKTDVALLNKAIITNNTLTSTEREQLDIIRSRFGYCRASNCNGIVQEKPNSATWNGDDGMKLTEWSEEDEEKINNISEIIEHCTAVPYSGGTLTLNKEYKKELQYFLKSLRPQPKQEIYQSVKHDLAIKFMNYLDENRPEGKMCLSNGECEDIDKAFKENDWNKIIRYIEKYGRRN